MLKRATKSALLAQQQWKQVGGLWQRPAILWRHTWTIDLATDTATLSDQHGREVDSFPVDWASFVN